MCASVISRTFILGTESHPGALESLEQVGLSGRVPSLADPEAGCWINTGSGMSVSHSGVFWAILVPPAHPTPSGKGLHGFKNEDLSTS